MIKSTRKSPGPTPSGTNALSSRSALEAGAEVFASHLEVLPGLSRRTRHAYATDVRQLCRFLHTLIAGPTVSNVDAAAIRGFLQHLESRGLRPRTIARKLTSVRAFYDYLQQQGLSDGAPVRGIRPPVHRASPPLSSAQVRRLLQLPDRKSFAGSRDRALMELIYGCGLRLEEVLPLQVSHIEPEAARLQLATGERNLPLGRQSLRALTHYLRLRADLLSQREIQRVDAGALFVSSRGSRLRPRTAQQSIERLIRRLDGVDDDTGDSLRPRRGASALRTAFADHLLEAGADAAGVGELMGRRRAPAPSTMDLQAVQRRYDEAHPRGRRGGGSG